MTVYSPPFSSMFTYSNSERDLGNGTDADFFEHYKYIVDELFRVTMPGRLSAVHCMNLPALKGKHGYIGLIDFRGEIIRAHIDAGWVFHSEVCIWKDPVVAMQRTKALGLLHKQIVKDSTRSRMGIPDYVCTFRKPGDNPEEVAGPMTRFVGDQASFKNTKNISIDIWQRYASPIWSDINQTRTLQYRTARHEDDERHICPLQLDVIERCMQLWSNEGDSVLSPFMGIGSEGYVAVTMGRKFVGVELKESYYDVACKNLVKAEQELNTKRLF
jgi:hypothetical protein